MNYNAFTYEYRDSLGVINHPTIFATINNVSGLKRFTTWWFDNQCSSYFEQSLNFRDRRFMSITTLQIDVYLNKSLESAHESFYSEAEIIWKESESPGRNQTCIFWIAVYREIVIEKGFWYFIVQEKELVISSLPSYTSNESAFSGWLNLSQWLSGELVWYVGLCRPYVCVYVCCMYRSAQEKTLFSRSLGEQKFLNANFRGVRFRVSLRRPFFSPRLFADKLGVSPRNFAQILRENSRSHLKTLTVFFVLFDMWFYVPVNNYGHVETVG